MFGQLRILLFIQILRSLLVIIMQILRNCVRFLQDADEKMWLSTIFPCVSYTLFRHVPPIHDFYAAHVVHIARQMA